MYIGFTLIRLEFLELSCWAQFNYQHSKQHI